MLKVFNICDKVKSSWFSLRETRDKRPLGRTETVARLTATLV